MLPGGMFCLFLFMCKILYRQIKFENNIGFMGKI